MAFEFDLDKVKETLVNAGKEVEDKAKEASAVAKIKYEMHTKESFLEKQYALLGRAFYEAHKEEDIPEKVYFTSIIEAEEEIKRLNAELLEVQGATECPNCGNKQDADKAYCADCGTALK